jgi:hypothetical protein
MKTIENRKRRSEDYACDEERKVAVTRAKLDVPFRWNHQISNGMSEDIDGEDFLSKIPPNVLLDFVRQRPSTFKKFLNTRNSSSYTPDETWMLETKAYQKHSNIWMEGKLDVIRKGVRPFKTLRDYRLRTLPLQITCLPSTPFFRFINKPVYLPYGSYVFVKQGFCQYATVYMSRKIHDEDYVSLTIDQAWGVVAGPQVTREQWASPSLFAERRELFNAWNETPCEPHMFQRALMRILEEYNPVLPFGDKYLPSGRICDGKFYLRLSCDESSPRAYTRSIRFNISSDSVQQYDAIIESCGFPMGINTCIAGFL